MAGMASAKEGLLEVHLSQILSQAKAEAAFIKVDITNHGDTALLLPRPFTPLEQMDGHLLNNIFAGYYEISYEQGYTGLASYQSDDEPLVTEKSNTLRIYANENLIQGEHLKR